MSLNTNEVIIRQLEEQLADYENDLGKMTSQAKKLRDCMQTIAEKVCDSDYGKSQLSGKNLMTSLEDIALRDFIIQNVLKQRINFTKSIRDLQKIFLQEQREKDEIAQQLLNMQKERDEYKLAYENIVKAKENMVNNTINVPNITPNIPSDSNTKVEKKVEKSDVGKANLIYYENMPYDINEVYNKTDVYQLKMLQIIGQTGYSETNDIVEECTKQNELGSHTVIRDNLKLMVENKLLETETISTPIRRKLTLYSMTPIGVEIYRKEYRKKPLKDEKTRIKEMHATLQHGYCIKDTAKILGDLGYSNVCMDSTKNAIEVANNRRYVPDIVANFDAKTKTYWEVELGHHKDGDFYEKLEKAAKVTSTVYVVVNDMQSWDKLKKQITGFKLKLKQEHRTIKLTVVLGTMTQLSKKDIFFNNPENKFILG